MKHARTLCALAAVFAVLVGVPWAASATVYVDPTAPGPNDGTSWSQAFTTLQPAIDAAWAAGGDEVWVAGGPAGSPVVYGEARTEAWGSASVTGSLVMKDNVHMYGGFEGYRGGAGAQETALSQRALALNLAVINGATARGGSAAYHVVVFGRSAAPTVNAILDGFHITGGNASGEPGDYHTWRGGGIYNWGSAPVIANCVIYGNSAEVSGGGVANVSGVVGPADAVLTNCVIADNTANRGADTAGNPIRGGGGVFNDVADPVIRHATIAGNTIGNAGYTLFGANSGGMYNWESSPVIDSSIIKQNTVGNLQDDILFGSLEVSVVSYTNVGYAYPVYQPDGSWTVTGGAVPAGPGNINQAPNFSGAYPFPYQAEVAPCVDAGNPASPVALDARTANRPLGAAIDMGAYEYSANGPAAVCQAATVTLDAAGNGTLTASAIDGGSSAEAGTHTLVADQTAFGCADVGTPSVSLTVTDKLGRTASCNATVTVEDVTVPVITQCAADQGVPVDASCEGTIPDMTANVIATDACGIASVTQNPTAGSTFTGSALVTFTVTDNNSNTETCTATVTGLDSDPPVITTCAGDQTLAVNASCQAAIPDLTGAVVYTDVCAVTVTQDPAAGTLVGLGDTVVTLRAEDASGNFDECTATVTVEDTADPVITSCAADQNIAADATCQAAIPDLTGAVAYTDDCAVTVTQLPAAGTLVGLGDTVVTLRAEDASGNFAECTATVTVTDAAPAAPALLAVAPDTGVAGDFITNAADITLQGTVGSAVPGTVLNVRLAPVSGVLPAVFAAQYEDIPTLGGAFAVPINGVAAMTYYMVFQTENNCGTLSAWSSEYTVIVDRTAPTITTCPADRDVTADTSCQGAIPDLTGDLVATDNVAGTLAVSQSPVAGTLVGLGATTVTMTVEDLAGNTSTCDVVVTVVDTPPAAPVLVQMVPDTGVAGDFITSATDFQLQGTVGSAVAGTLLNVRLHLVTGLLPAVYAAQYEDVPTAGGLFAVPLTGVAPGTYYLVFQTENNCGTLSAWSSEHTVVVDTAVPVITACAPDRQVAADGTCQGAVPDLTGDVAATDNVPGTLAVTQSPIAGTVVAMGDTTVTLTVTDLAGNTSTCDTTVTVADLTGPAFTACAPDRALAPGPGCTGTVPDMLAEVTATDVCGTVVDIVQSPAAGEPFTGAVTVVFTATDDSGNTGTCETLVSLVDTENPVAVCQNITVDPADGTVTGADIDGGSTDNCIVQELLVDGAASVTFTCADLGDNTVTLTVRDANGNEDTCTATVTVADTTDPVIVLNGDASVVLDNGETYTELGATATDACDGDLTGILVTGGDTVNDRVPGVYTVTYTVSDAAGNEAVAARTVTVQRVACALVVEAAATDVDASPGDTVTLEVTLGAGNCAVGDIHYDWKKDDGSKALVSLPGAADDPVLTLASVTVADSGVYVCEVSDDMYSVQSPEITLTVAAGVPVAGGLGLALLAAAAALTGAGAIRRRR